MHFGDFGPGHGPRQHGNWEGGGQRRVRRGNVRAAVLALLIEQPMHGYQMIQELSRRSGGHWSPSPGSIYPTLQMLEDEGLVTSRASEDGKRLYDLTEAGRAEAARLSGAASHKPWEHHGPHWGAPPQDLMTAIVETGRLLLASVAAGTDEQRARIVELLTKLNQDLEAAVPNAAAGAPFAGWPRGPRGRSAPGWPFGIPDWIFGGRPGWGGPPSGGRSESPRRPGPGPGRGDEDGDDGDDGDTVLL
jgi:DNA-binding PadR family transcriptional regulator